MLSRTVCRTIQHRAYGAKWIDGRLVVAEPGPGATTDGADDPREDCVHGGDLLGY